MSAICVAALCLLIASPPARAAVVSGPSTGSPTPRSGGPLRRALRRRGDAAERDPAVRIVARYRTSCSPRPSPDDAAALVAAGAVRRDDMRRVTLQTRSVDPLAQEAASRTPRRGRPASRRATAAARVVQFVGPLKDDWLARLRRRACTVVSSMAENAELVHAEGAARAALERLRRLGRARCAARSRCAAADKIAGGIGAGQRRRRDSDDRPAPRAPTRARRPQPTASGPARPPTSARTRPCA